MSGDWLHNRIVGVVATSPKRIKTRAISNTFCQAGGMERVKRATGAQSLTYPKAFRARQIATNGTKLYVRVGGSGPTVVLLHGYGETGDMWVPLAKDLVPDHTVVVPDLRAMGLSAKPAGGYDKKTQGGD